MIPKIIHFCWFGGNPLPPLALECIASWRKFLPEYEIWMWVEDPSLPSLKGQECTPDKVMEFDVNSIPYTAEAYKQKKYAFVSDYCRFAAIYKYGGIYFDTDVEVIRPMDEIIAKGNFMGFEVDPDGENTPEKYAPRYCFAVNPGVGFGMEKEHPFMRNMLDHYHKLKFELPPSDIAWYKTIVAYTTEMLCSKGLKNVQGVQIVRFDEGESERNESSNGLSGLSGSNGVNGLNGSNGLNITIYPHEYFAPIDVITGRLHITENTYTIHRYMGSWNGDNTLTIEGVKRTIRGMLPEWVFYLINKIKRRRYRIL